MAPLASNTEDTLRTLPLPLHNIGKQSLLSNRQFADATQEALHAQRSNSSGTGLTARRCSLCGGNGSLSR